MSDHIDAVRREFERTARTFAKRTAGRFDQMNAVGFSEIKAGASVLEVGAGTGNFLSLFNERASMIVAVDVTAAMLSVARELHAIENLVVADGSQLPLSDGSFDLVACAQMLHHVPEPTPLLSEMMRVAGTSGRVLIVDQVASDDPSEALAMNEMEIIRDPSHAASRSGAEFRRLMIDAGMEVVKEKRVEQQNTFENWMLAEEFPAERVALVRKFIEEHGFKTGMEFGEQDGKLTFTRRRILLLGRARILGAMGSRKAG